MALERYINISVVIENLVHPAAEPPRLLMQLHLCYL